MGIVGDHSRHSCLGAKHGLSVLSAILWNVSGLLLLSLYVMGLSPQEQTQLNEQIKSLKELAVRQGAVRVIVHLAVQDTEQPETARDRFLSLMKQSAKAITPLGNLPLVAMDVDAEGLDMIARSGLVVRIEEDKIDAAY